MNTSGHPAAARLQAVRRGVAASALALLAAVGCDSEIFQAANPATLDPGDLTSPAALDALTRGTIGEFDNAYDNVILYTAILSDEAIASGSWPPWHQATREGFINIDAPIGAGNIPTPLWNTFHRARFLAEDTYERLEEHAPDHTSDMRAAIARLYSGMSYILFGDVFCQAAYDGGPAVSPAESYQSAVTHLTDAIQIGQAAGNGNTFSDVNADLVSMAYLQRARAHLQLGNSDQALQDARQVQQGLRWVAHYQDAAGEQQAAFFQLNIRLEGTIDVAFHDTGDPRVPVVDGDEFGPDLSTPVWLQTKYTSRGADMPIGRWQEARLIEAEVLIGQGQVGEAVTVMNQVRAAAGLDPLPAGLSAAEAEDALRTERKHEFFLENTTRLVDMRRWGLFPAGWGASCVPISRGELDTNPNL